MRPACHGVSYLLPGVGECNLACRLRADCRAAYLAAGREALATDQVIAPEERAWLLYALGLGAAVDPPAAGETRTGRRERRKPLAAFRPASVPALAASCLRDAARPLHVREVTAAVLRVRQDLRGKTPAASVGLALRQVSEIHALGRGIYAWVGVVGADEERPEVADEAPSDERSKP